MSVRKHTIDEYVEAIVDRDSGNPYPSVLDKYGMTANEFGRAATRDIGYLIENSEEPQTGILLGVASDEPRRSELFNMGEDFVRTQYDRIQGRIEGETQRRFYLGTFLNYENVVILVYYALTLHNPQLASPDRAEVIEGFKRLGSEHTHLQKYLKTIGLGGLMNKVFGGFSLAFMQVFDVCYCRKYEGPSLFDLSQPTHLHPWMDILVAPNAYWHDQRRVQEAVYHILTENHPQLTSDKREVVEEGIRKLPKLTPHFYDIGLGGVMVSELGDSPLAVLKVFDRAYQETTGMPSLHVDRLRNLAP